MDKIMLLYWIYLLCMNILAFILYGVDKQKAKKNAWRIKEKTLLLYAILGGGIGAWVGMKVFHHKTLHPKFYITVPIFTTIWTILSIYLFFHVK